MLGELRCPLTVLDQRAQGSCQSIKIHVGRQIGSLPQMPGVCIKTLESYLSCLFHIETLGQQVGNVDETHQVIHIALNAACYPWVLDLHGKASPIMQLASMHLRGQQDMTCWLRCTQKQMHVCTWWHQRTNLLASHVSKDAMMQLAAEHLMAQQDKLLASHVSRKTDMQDVYMRNSVHEQERKDAACLNAPVNIAGQVLPE